MDQGLLFGDDAQRYISDASGSRLSAGYLTVIHLSFRIFHYLDGRRERLEIRKTEVLTSSLSL